MIQSNSTANFSLATYLKAVGVPEYFSLKPSVETLYFIVNKHVMNIPYGNFVFHLKEGKIASLSPADLQERTLIQKEGVMCFEAAELMYQVLLRIGFDVHRIVSFPLNNTPYNPKLPPTHIILIVKIENEYFLVDIGYGYNSLRYPLKFSFEKTEENVLNDYEKYQLVVNTDYYQLNMWIKGEWFSFYRFDNPLKFIEFSDLEKYHLGLLEYPESLFIRDKYIICGKLTEHGRISYQFERKSPNFNAIKVVYQKNTVSKTIIQDYKTLKESIEESLEIKVPSEDQLKT